MDLQELAKLDNNWVTQVPGKEEKIAFDSTLHISLEAFTPLFIPLSICGLVSSYVAMEFCLVS